MIKMLLLACMMMTTTLLLGQGNKIEGKIENADAAPVEGASVHVLNTNRGTFTDDQGYFSIALDPGKYELHITAVGYASVDQSVDMLKGSEPLHITLQESARQLNDVIVTAQKEEENLQHVPFSTTALSSQEVNEFRIWNAREITAIIPNLYSANPGDNRNVTSIRGITSSSYDPSVATYIDGVNQFSLDTYIAQLFDVERIEVLRGPQGTLYGRNAMGGVINIHTKQPDNKTRGFAEVNIGNYGQQRYALGVRTPVVPGKLFLGLSGLYDQSNGFYTNDFDNSDFDKHHSFTGNYYLTYLASPRWALTLNVKNHVHRNNGAFPLSGSVDGAFENPFRVNQNAVTELVDNVFNSSLVANYAGSKLNFSSQTTYQSNYRYYKSPIDGDFSPIDGITIINNYGKDWNFVEAFTQEFKVTSPAASTSPLKWTGGTYLFTQNVPFKLATRFGEDAGYIDPNINDTNFSIINTSTGKSRGIAVYGQATYAVSSKVDVTAGLRFDHERKEQSGLAEYQHDPDPNPIFAILPDTSASLSFNAVSPKVSVAYHANERSNLYAVYSRGFRAGGLTQLSPDPSQAPMFAYKPEFSNNIEVGLKQTFPDKRFQVNAALFYIKVNDAQVPTLVLPEAVTVTRNAGELTSKGFEFELAATPVDGLQVNYSFGYTDATYNTLNVPSNGESVNLAGNHQIFTPRVTSMLAIQYAYNLGISSPLRLVLRGEWMYLGTQYFDLANAIRQSPYNLLNVRLGLASDSFEFMVWGRNLSDETYISYAYDFGATHLGDPRNWGVSVMKRFGKK
jgi:iron complex outermembrane recepter protein